MIKKQLDCTSVAAQKIEFQIKIPLSRAIGIIQACQYVLDNQNEFKKVYECPNCLDSIEEFQQLLGECIEGATEHYKTHLN